MRILTALVMCSSLLATASSAYAQSTTTPARPNTACTPGIGHGSPTVGSGEGSNLSDKLAESRGVICPPASADKEMAVQPPAGGRTPIIPPPGSPGGGQNVQPK